MAQPQAVASDHPGLDEIGTFLAAMAAALRETVGRLDTTVGRVTEFAAAQPGRADRDVVMTLQDFDRLQQEFAAIAETLRQAADKSGETWLRTDSSDHPARDVIDGISLAELRERLLRHLSASMTDLLALPTSDETIF